MERKNTHTWNTIIEYLRCPHCGYILENRDNYHDSLGVLKKEVQCSQCHHTFTVFKKMKVRFGPLIGENQPPEIDWS